MGKWFTNQQPVLSQRDMLENRYKISRGNLLGAIVFTAINMILMIAGADTYFLFSIFVPYLLVTYGVLFGGMAPAEYYQEFGLDKSMCDMSIFYVLLAIALVILAVYLVSWIFSKKRRVGWLITALVLFSLDTVAMFLFSGGIDSIIDLVFHAWVLFELVRGIVAHFKLKKLPEEPLPEEAFAEEAEPLEENPVEAEADTLI